MLSLLGAWLASLRHVFSFLYWHHVGRALHRALPSVLIVLGCFCAVVGLAFLRIPYISLPIEIGLRSIPPVMAMLFSPFYIPFLIGAVRGQSTVLWADRWSAIRWSCLGYGLILLAIGGLYIVYFEASVECLLWAVAVLCCAVLVSLPCLLSFPVFSAAVVLPPMNTRSVGAVWRHAKRMTLYEFPGLLLVMFCLWPFSYVVYQLAAWLACMKCVPPLCAYALVHGATLLSWQIGWVLFLVYYQQRKRPYMGTE